MEYLHARPLDTEMGMRARCGGHVQFGAGGRQGTEVGLEGRQLDVRDGMKSDEKSS